MSTANDIRRIVTLGPEGTFSHEAATNLFPDAEIILAPNFDAVFERASREGIPGLVPFENSLHGSVDEVLDLLVESDVQVWQTHDVAIRHALGCLNLKQIQKVASHPQALAQCRRYLHERFPTAEHFPVNSTAYAVEIALQDPTIAAVASRASMESRGLPVLEDDLTEDGNTTRFAVIAKTNPFPNLKRTQMGIVFHPTGDRPGLLHAILTPFKIYDVNLTRIENRPTGKGLGDYLFFLHFEGTPDSARVQKALEEFKAIEGVKIVKVLGAW